jgi:hypothetical protein
MLGYRPEYRLDTFESSDGPSFTKWKEIPWDIGVAPYGHPYPRLFGGVLQTCGLLGPAQAQAIAWAYAAQVEGTTGAKEIEVRIIEYEVKYDIATTRKEP